MGSDDGRLWYFLKLGYIPSLYTFIVNLLGWVMLILENYHNKALSLLDMLG